MKIKNIEDINAFRAAIDKCKGDVWIASANGDRFDLKSSFSQYLAIGELIKDKQEELELFCGSPADEGYLMEFIWNHS